MPAIDTFAGQNTINQAGPYRWAELVSKSDTVDLGKVSRAIYVGGTGHIQLTLADMPDDTYVLMSNLAVGFHNLRVKRIWNANTTATLMVALA